MKRGFEYATAALAVLVVGAAALIVLPASDAPLPDPADSRIITNVRIVEVASGTVSAPSSVLIRRGIIAAIGPDVQAGQLPQVDGTGAYLAPAFWDMHAHTFQVSPQLHLPLWVANGVTNLRDMMDCPERRDSLIACVEDKRRWNAEIAGGRLAAPRIVEVASYYLESPNILPPEAVSRVRSYRAMGVDAIKVYNRLSREAYLAAAGEARSQGLRLVGHLPKAVPLEEGIEAGQASFEHAHLLPRHCWGRNAEWLSGALDALAPTVVAEAIVSGHDAERCQIAIAAMARAKAWYVPTHVTREEDARSGDRAFTEDHRLAYLDPLSRWAWEDDLEGTRQRYPGSRGQRALGAYFDHGLRLTAKAHENGVGILVGTDTVIGGFRFHDEMAHLVRAGLTPEEALRAATLDAARYAGEEQTSGSVEVGKRADLVLLDANPLDNIANTRRIRAVVQGGRLYDRQRLDGLLAFVRAQANAPHNWAKMIWGLARSSVRSEL